MSQFLRHQRSSTSTRSQASHWRASSTSDLREFGGHSFQRPYDYRIRFPPCQPVYHTYRSSTESPSQLHFAFSIIASFDSNQCFFDFCKSSSKEKASLKNRMAFPHLDTSLSNQKVPFDVHDQHFLKSWPWTFLSPHPHICDDIVGRWSLRIFRRSRLAEWERQNNHHH